MRCVKNFPLLSDWDKNTKEHKKLSNFNVLIFLLKSNEGQFAQVIIEIDGLFLGTAKVRRLARSLLKITDVERMLSVMLGS
jgi:hypothetical protein